MIIACIARIRPRARTGTSDWPSAHAGTLEAMRTQVLYY